MFFATTKLNQDLILKIQKSFIAVIETISPSFELVGPTIK